MSKAASHLCHTRPMGLQNAGPDSCCGMMVLLGCSGWGRALEPERTQSGVLGENMYLACFGVVGTGVLLRLTSAKW